MELPGGFWGSAKIDGSMKDGMRGQQRKVSFLCVVLHSKKQVHAALALTLSTVSILLETSG